MLFDLSEIVLGFKHGKNQQYKHQTFKKTFHAERPVSQHNNGDSLNMNKSHVFLVNVAWSIVYTEKRETHWGQLLRSIWASQSLTHLHCCSHQPAPAAALVHHAVPLNTQQGQFAAMEISACRLHFQHFLTIISPASGNSVGQLLRRYLKNDAAL